MDRRRRLRRQLSDTVSLNSIDVLVSCDFVFNFLRLHYDAGSFCCTVCLMLFEQMLSSS